MPPSGAPQLNQSSAQRRPMWRKQLLQCESVDGAEHVAGVCLSFHFSQIHVVRPALRARVVLVRPLPATHMVSSCIWLELSAGLTVEESR